MPAAPSGIGRRPQWECEGGGPHQSLSREIEKKKLEGKKKKEKEKEKLDEEVLKLKLMNWRAWLDQAVSSVILKA